MPAFVKTPRFIISTIFLIWLIAVIWDNHAEPSVNVWFGPFLHSQIRLVWILVGSAIFGAVVTVVVQLMWTHRASKNASSSVAA
jgi:uncharacterized integral membrane protein